MGFCVCSGCGFRWTTRDELLSDPQVSLSGYQVQFDELKTGLFLFNHMAPGCHTTFSIVAEAFMDLHEGPIFSQRLVGSSDCLGLCVRTECLEPCPKACECAYVRAVLAKVNTWPKQRSLAGV